MPDDDKILEYVPRKKSLKVPFIIYADLKCLLKTISMCQNNPEKSYTEKKAVHKSSGYFLITCCSFDKSGNERKYYRGKDCMKMFCNDLKEQANKIVNYEMKEMIPLTTEEEESYENQEICYICQKKFGTNKNNKKVKDHCYYTGKYKGAAHSICNLRYKVTKEIPIVFHNGSTYDHHFIIRQLPTEFNGFLNCLGENTEKYITFSVPIKKVIYNVSDNDTDKNKPEVIIYRLKFIDSHRSTSYSLSTLVDKLSGINTKEHGYSFIGNKMLYSLSIEKFYNTYQLSNNDLNKFALLLRKGVYPYEFMVNWKRFKELVPLEEDYYYSNLNMEGITKEDTKHVKNLCNTFKIKIIGEYHNLYVQSDTTLLADVFENFRDKCIEISKIDPAHFLSVPGLAWTSMQTDVFLFSLEFGL